VARLTAPLVWLLQRSTDALLRLLRMRGPTQSSVTEEEIRTLIAEGTREGIFHKAEHSMIEGVLKLADRSVRSIMVPRGEVAWLDLDDSRESLLREVRGSVHSRYLVCRGELDELVGVARTRDLLQWMRGEAEGEADLAKFTRPALVVQETTTVLKLLELFRESAMHFAVIVDEHGSIEGIVTPTDVLQAIAGDLPDVDSADAPEAVRREDASWLMDGRIPIGDAERFLGRSDMVSGDDYTTLAGFVLAQLGHVPATAETFIWKDLRFEVVDMDGRRIDKVLVQPRQPPSVRSTT
jgi:putative hemolysin